jgi:hypothetical protein
MDVLERWEEKRLKKIETNRKYREKHGDDLKIKHREEQARYRDRNKEILRLKDTVRYWKGIAKGLDSV